MSLPNQMPMSSRLMTRSSQSTWTRRTKSFSVTQDKTPEKPGEDEDNVLAALSEIYDSEGVVSSQLTNLVDKWSKRCCLRRTLKKSWGNTTDLRIVKT